MAQQSYAMMDGEQREYMDTQAAHHGITTEEMMAQSMQTWKKRRIGRYWIRGDCFSCSVNGNGGIKALPYPVTMVIDLSEEVLDNLWESGDWDQLERMKTMR